MHPSPSESSQNTTISDDSQFYASQDSNESSGSSPRFPGTCPTQVINTYSIPPTLQQAHFKRGATNTASKNHTYPSIKLALADSFLTQSLKDSGKHQGTSRMGKHRQKKSQFDAKREYERNVRRYYYQLTVGCGKPNCPNKLCTSCPAGPRIPPEAASVMAIQLASRSRQFFCSNCPADPILQEFPVVPTADNHSTSSSSEVPSPSDSAPTKETKSFLYSLFTASSFASIFSSNDNDTQKDKDEPIASTPTLSRATSRSKQTPTTPTTPSSSNSPHLQRTPSKRHTNPIPPPSVSTNSRTTVRRSNSFQLAAATSPISLRKDSTSSIRSSEVATNRSVITTYPATEESNIVEILPRNERGLMDLPGFLATGLRKLVSGQVVDVLTPSSLLPGSKLESTRRTSEEEGTEDLNRRRISTSSANSSPYTTNDEIDDVNSPQTTRSGSTFVTQTCFTDSFSGIENWGLETLNLDLVKRAIATYTTSGLHEQGDSRFLVNTIKRVMSDWEGLGRSFLFTEPAEAGAQLDLTQLRESYKILLSLKPEYIFESAVSNAFELLLAGMEANLEGFMSRALRKDSDAVTEEWARSLICVAECPIVVGNVCLEEDNFSWHYDRDLLKRVVAILGSIGRSPNNTSTRKQIVKIFTGWDAEGFRKFVGVLQTSLVEIWHPHPVKTEDRIVDVLETLRLCFDTNNTRQLIPHSAFYNHELIKRINLKEEYRIWKRLQVNNSSLAISLPSSSHKHKSPSFLTSAFSSNAPHPTSTFTYMRFPFLFDPSTKARILRIDAMQQMSEEYEDACVNHTLVMHAQRLLAESPRMARDLERNLRGATNPYLVIEVRREKLVEDAMDEVGRRWSDRKKPLKVRFVGGGEDGMDQGGVQKEFLGLLMSSLVDSNRGLFVRDDDGDKTRLGWFADTAVHDPYEDLEALYEFCGVVIGLAVYNGVMLNIGFPSVFWKILACVAEDQCETRADEFGFDELEIGWPSLARGLRQMLDWPESEGDVYDVFLRSFEISFEVLGEVKTFELIPGGADIPVTNENRREYVRLYCRYFLYSWVRQRLLAVRRGFWSVAGGMGVRLLGWDELEMVVCGRRGTSFGDKGEDEDDYELDLTELEKVAGYDDDYDADHYVIKNFWSIIHRLSTKEKLQLLLFVTASDRIPIGGLKDLTFIIQRNGPDSDRLPTALTCFSRLLLPEYSTPEKLEERLLTAIGNARGFGLV